MTIYVGVDVSKAMLDVQLGDDYIQIQNTHPGLKKLIQQLKLVEKKGNTIKLITCEASGGYERLMLNTLKKYQYPTHLAHANHVTHFAKATGQRAKTDKIDARIIRDYSIALKITADVQYSSEITEAIKELVKRREQLVSARQGEKNRIEKAHSSVRPSIKSHIKWLDKSIKQIEDELKKSSEHDEVKQRYALLTSIPSIGFIIASAIIAYLPELGELTHKQLVALVGVAPYNHDSGKHTGKRYIKGGRKSLRNYLYMSSISSLRWNKELKCFYDRLRQKGKPAKVALTAVMRKLVTILNSVMKRQTEWKENFV